MPNMMLGTAASNSTATPIGLFNSGGHISVRNRAMPNPAGTASSIAISEVTTVPKIGAKRAEFVGHRIPDLARDERESEMSHRRPGAVHQRGGHSAQDQQHQNRRAQRGGAEDSLVNQLLCGVPRIDDRHDVSFAPAIFRSTPDGRPT